MPHEIEMVDLMNKPANFTALYNTACADEQARAKVPLLEVSEGGPILVESNVILEYLYDLAVDHDSGGGLNALQKANARLFTTLCQPKLSFIGILKAEPDSEDEAKAVQELRTGLRDMDLYLQQHGDPEGPFLFGETFSLLAEAVLSPFVLRLVNVLPGMRPHIDPMTFMEEDGLSRLAKWTHAVSKRESCTSTLPTKDELVTGYSKMLDRMKQAAAPATR